MNRSKKPLIAVNCDLREEEKGSTLFLRSRYVEAIREAGAIPYLLAPLPSFELSELLRPADGLLLVGGDDLSPSLYGGGARRPEEVPLHPVREAFDMALLAEARARRMPLLAICLGLQELCVAAGGRLHAFIPEDVKNALEHRAIDQEPRFHEIDVVEGTRLRRLFDASARVNSSHKQAVSEPGEGLFVAARSPDGVIEAVEDRNSPFCVGVQWHPELMTDDPAQARLFQALAAAAAGIDF